MSDPLNAKFVDGVSPIACPVCGENKRPDEETPLLEIDQEIYRLDADPFKREPGWSLELARQGHLQWACNSCIEDGAAVTAQPWLQNWGDYEPFYAYFDTDQHCASCGKDFVFRADEQRFWYEEKRFNVQSYPKNCLNCRRRHRDKKKHAPERRHGKRS